jgi:hypothetical protein
MRFARFGFGEKRIISTKNYELLFVAFIIIHVEEEAKNGRSVLKCSLRKFVAQEFVGAGF